MDFLPTMYHFPFLFLSELHGLLPGFPRSGAHDPYSDPRMDTPFGLLWMHSFARFRVKDRNASRNEMQSVGFLRIRNQDGGEQFPATAVSF